MLWYVFYRTNPFESQRAHCGGDVSYRAPG